MILADRIDASDLLACADALQVGLRAAGGDLLVEVPTGADEADIAVLLPLLRRHKPAVIDLLAHDSEERAAIEAGGGP